jgi:hypothetical protein
MNVVVTNLRATFLALVFGLMLATTGGASAADRLSEVGARLSAVGVEASRVTVTRDVTVDGDTVTASFVTAHTASGKSLRRDHLGFWQPWDGRLSNLIDNRFPVVNGQITFKILKDEDMSRELFPVTVTVAYHTQSTLKFGVFELRATGSGAGQ